MDRPSHPLEESAAGSAEGEPEAGPRGPEVLVFRHENTLFAVPVGRVDAIIGWRAPVEVPAAVSALAGLVQHEGRVVAVVHGPSGHADPVARAPTRIIVCPTRRGLVGLPASSTVGVTSLALEIDLERASQVETPHGSALVVEPEAVATKLAGNPGAPLGHSVR